MIYKKYTKPGETLKKSMIKNKPNKKMGEKADKFKMNIEREFTTYNESIKSDSKESISTRINERDMITQRGCNPFLSQNNYLNDLMNQEKYIRQNNNLNTQQ